MVLGIVKKTPNKARLLSFDLIRALCAVGIIVFHFSCELSDTVSLKVLHSYANGSWGNTIVNIFFLISGAMLYYNNSEIKSLKKFYYKRFKSIFPMFYIAFLFFYFLSAAKSRNAFYGGNPIKLFMTVLGIDGFFQYRMVNYYQVGEWFLGAIIFLYALYPLILKIFNKSSALITSICIILYGTVFIPNIWRIQQGANLFACLISFVLGMVFIKYKDKWYGNLPLFIISTVFSALIIFVRFDFIPENLYNHILAIALFVSLAFIGEAIMKVTNVSLVFKEISAFSFAVFLFQHKVINIMFQIYMPSDNNLILYFAWLILIIVITLVLAKLLTLFTNWLLKTKAYLKFEGYILREKKKV